MLLNVKLFVASCFFFLNVTSLSSVRYDTLPCAIFFKPTHITNIYVMSEN